MKRFFKTFAVAMMAVGVLAFAGCNKDEDNNNDRQPIITSLAETFWDGSASITIPFGGQNIPVTVQSSLFFQDNTSASFSVSLVGLPGMDYNQDITYTWNGDNQGLLRFHDGDVTMAANDAAHITANMTSAVVNHSTGMAEMVFSMLGGTFPFQYTKRPDNMNTI